MKYELSGKVMFNDPDPKRDILNAIIKLKSVVITLTDDELLGLTLMEMILLLKDQDNPGLLRFRNSLSIYPEIEDGLFKLVRETIYLSDPDLRIEKICNLVSTLVLRNGETYFKNS